MTIDYEPQKMINYILKGTCHHAMTKFFIQFGARHIFEKDLVDYDKLTFLE